MHILGVLLLCTKQCHQIRWAFWHPRVRAPCGCSPGRPGSRAPARGRWPQWSPPRSRTPAWRPRPPAAPCPCAGPPACCAPARPRRSCTCASVNPSYNPNYSFSLHCAGMLSASPQNSTVYFPAAPARAPQSVQLALWVGTLDPIGASNPPLRVATGAVSDAARAPT